MGSQVSDPDRFIDYRKDPHYKIQHFLDIQNNVIYRQIGLLQVDPASEELISLVLETVLDDEPQILEVLLDRVVTGRLRAITEMEVIALAARGVV